jgi:signal transduction histidine kinase
MLHFAKSIVETVRHPLIVLDLKNRVLAANTAFYRTFHTDRANTEGRGFFELSGGAWDSPQLRTLLGKIVTADGAFDNFEIEQMIPTLGRRILVLSARRVTNDGDGAPVVLLAIEDETQRRQDDRALRRLNVDLEGAIAERTSELLDSNREIRDSVRELAIVNRELEAFCYSVSHDLRAPLRAIDGFSLELLESHSSQMDDQGKHYLGRIRSGIQRMGQLIDDLLSLSRVTRDEMNRESVDLSALAESVAAELRQLEPERKVSFLAQPALSANCDPRMIRIVLDNLFGNAWKFTSKKPGASIEFRQTEVQGQLAFVVRDDGAGFDPAFAKKLFGAFQRLHSDREFPGTGLGLATVQRIIRRHGGEAWAEGAVDKGAAFYFTLPNREKSS